MVVPENNDGFKKRDKDKAETLAVASFCIDESVLEKKLLEEKKQRTKAKQKEVHWNNFLQGI